jgi:hypothetical protein
MSFLPKRTFKRCWIVESLAHRFYFGVSYALAWLGLSGCESSELFPIQRKREVEPMSRLEGRGLEGRSSFVSRVDQAAAVLLVAVSLSACSPSVQVFGEVASSGKATEVAIDGNFDGCVDGIALDQSRIRITLAHPPESTRMTVFRDGMAVATLSTELATFTDNGLAEGQTYRYSCEASIKGRAVLGEKILSIQTVALNAPNFGGAVSATAQNSSSVKVTWVPPTGSPPAELYRVYYNPGASVDWTQSPKASVPAGTFEYIATGLGDQIPYSFGVRACAAGSICDSNTVLRAVTPPDGGPPRTTGVASVTANNGRLAVVAPWNDSLGAIQRRRVYLRSGAVGGLNLADYTLGRTEFVSNLAAVPSTIYVNGVLESTTYHVIVVDEDPSNQQNLPPTNFFTINTGDMTPPSFTGVSSVTLVAGAEDTQVDLGFTAFNRQNSGENDVHGASEYAVYVAWAAYPETPPNACDAVSPFVSFASDTHAPGPSTYRLQGLSQRRTYSICLKARDNAGNISTNTSALAITTRDITPPVFDGVQAIDYFADSASLRAQWIASSSSDITTYRIRLWKNIAPASVTAGSITTFNRAASSFATGWEITAADYAVTDLDTVYIVVDACDNANIIPGGVEACTNFAFTTAKSAVLPDVSPPLGFLGVAPASSLVAVTQGQVTVRWSVEPGQWGTGYQGFRIYDYNTTSGALTFLRDCSCAGACDGTGAGDTECTVGGLDAFRTYRFHVRAFDAGGNLTQLNPLNSQSQKRTTDTTAPVFSSSLTVGAAPTFTLTWDAASDNQYAAEPGSVLNYQVWRKIGTTFTNPSMPHLDGGASLLVTQSARTYSDSLLEGVPHFYVVCALDMSGNRTCDGANVRSFTTTDLTPPTLSDITSTWDPLRKRWDLGWTMLDSITPTGSLLVSVYRRVEDAGFQWATTDDVLVSSAAGITALNNLSGPTGLLRYLSYRVVVRDLAGNTTSKAIRMKVDNRITVTSVRRSQGPTAGGKWIHVRGTGFTKGSENGFGTSTTVTLGGNACTDVTVFNEDRLICRTPAGTLGSVEVRVTNPEGSQASMAAAYAYTNASTDPCDNPANTVSGHPTYGGGAGTQAAPYILCTADQVQSMPNPVPANRYYHLGDNIDLSTATTPVNQKILNGSISLTGDGLFLSGYSSTVPLFTAAPAGSEVSNISFYNFSLEANNGANLALVFQSFSGTVQNMGLVGSMRFSGTASGFLAGFAAQVPNSGAAFNGIFNDLTIHSSTTNSANTIGGLTGPFFGSLQNVRGRTQITTTTPSSLIGGLVTDWSYSAPAQAVVNTVGQPHGANNIRYRVEITLSDVPGVAPSIGGLAARTMGNLWPSGSRINDVHLTGFINNYRSGPGNPQGGIVGWHSNAWTNTTALPLVRCSVRMNQIYRLTSTAGGGGFLGRVDADTGPVVPATALVENSFFEGSIGAAGVGTGGNNLGGLIGQLAARNPGVYSIQDNLTLAQLDGQLLVSGVVGATQVGNFSRNLSFSSASASATPPTSNLAALIRYLGNPTDSCSQSYWDDTIGPPGNYTPNVCPDGALSTAETKDQSNFEGLDFTNTWKMSDPDGHFQGRPILQWMEDE